MLFSPLTLSIGVGLVIGLLFVEFLGLSVGGMVVPGYIALVAAEPITIILTLLTAVLVFVTVRILSNSLVIYGKRRIAVTVLLSFIFGAIIRMILSSVFVVSSLGEVYTVIGYIIPGLIAISFDRQGVIETTTTLIIAAVVVRLLLIVFIGPALLGAA